MDDLTETYRLDIPDSIRIRRCGPYVVLDGRYNDRSGWEKSDSETWRW